MVVRIETDNAGSPSELLLDPNSTATIQPSALSTSFDWITIQFPTSLKFTSGTKYWIVLQRTGATNTVHSYSVGKHTSDVYTPGETKAYLT
jgi:hypothetical protein